jgi:adenylylsulfate kinase
MAAVAPEAFAIWITGLPASGKSTLTKAVEARLAARGVDVAVLESDELRRVLTPKPRYDEKERETFYAQTIWIGTLLVRHGVPVIFDATANRRNWRERARQAIPRFVEVYVECSLEVCMARDPKGIYRRARQGDAGTVPGLQAAYEPPRQADIVVAGDRESPECAAGRVIELLIEKGYLARDGDAPG